MPDTIGATPPPPPAAPSKLKVFLRRLVSFVVLWTILLAALFSGNRLVSDYVFLVIMVLLAAAGLAEFYGLAAKRNLICFDRWGILGGLLLMVGTFLNLTGQLGTSGSPARVNDFETSFLILFVLGLCLRQFFSRSNTAGIEAIATTLFGLMYVPWLLNFIQKINFFPGVEGQYYLLYFVLITKFSDTGAYATGSLIGRHKMIPRISPGKTWEGFAGGIAGSLGGAVLVRFLLLPDVPLLVCLLVGLGAAVLGPLGDHSESIIKRAAGVKDSGKFIPGHGGVLDRIDALLFVTPWVYAVAAYSAAG